MSRQNRTIFVWLCLLTLLCFSSAFAQTDGESDDFFDNDAPAAEKADQGASNQTDGAEDDNSAASDGSEKLPEVSPDEDTLEKQTDTIAISGERLENVIPGDALVILRTTTVAHLNRELKQLLEKLGISKLSPVEMLRVSPYGKAVRAIDPKRTIGVIYLRGTQRPQPLVFLPVRDYKSFAEGLGADHPSEREYEPSEVKKVRGWSVLPTKGFAVLFKTEAAETAQRLQRTAPFALNRYTPSGLKAPDFSIEVTENGIQTLAQIAEIASRDFKPAIHDALSGVDLLDSKLDDETAAKVPEKISELLYRAGRNLYSVRIDGRIADNDIFTSTVLRPYQDTPLARQIADQGGPKVPTSLDGPSFLRVLPDTTAPIAGQMDISPEAAQEFDPPFNRVRHIEYSLALPMQGELLAESWSFFLEVDDAEAFVKELILPKAHEVGSYIGKEKAAELGAQLLGNLAARRRARGLPPLLFGSPEEAARQGESIGARLGSEMGGNMGEKQAMQTQRFEGYSLIVADMELYTNVMREKRAREAGDLPRKEIFITGEPTLRVLLGTLLEGLQTGSLEDSLRGQLHVGYQGNTPMMAKENLILTLDDSHILIVPGNRQMLRGAVSIWDDPSAAAEYQSSRYRNWEEDWDALCGEMNMPEVQLLRAVMRIDPPSVKNEADYIRQYYFSDLPNPFPKPIPRDLPCMLSVSTTAPETALMYGVIPNEIIRFFVDQFFDRPKKN